MIVEESLERSSRVSLVDHKTEEPSSNLSAWRFHDLLIVGVQRLTKPYAENVFLPQHHLLVVEVHSKVTGI